MTKEKVGKWVSKNSFNSFLIALSIGALVAVVTGWISWGWLRQGAEKPETHAETIRTAALLFGGMIALIFGIWRGWEAKRQSDAAQKQADATQEQVEAAQKQVEAAQRQIDASQRSMLNERFQNGTEMLGNAKLSARLGGIYALQRLANEEPEEYHMQILRMLLAFVRNPTEDTSVFDEELASEEKGSWVTWSFNLRPDVQAAMEAIAKRTYAGIEIERDEEFPSDLRGANLRGLALDNVTLSDLFVWKADLSRSSFNLSTLEHVNFLDTNLSPAVFARAELGNTSWENCPMARAEFGNAVFLEISGSEGFMDCDLSEADFTNADLSRVRFARSNLRGAKFDNANLSGTRFLDDDVNPELNLTQPQLDVAKSDPDNPPILEGIIDVQTGKPLVWRGSDLD